MAYEHIKKFTEDAEAGGFDWEKHVNPMNVGDANHARAFLMPDFWQAVGKTRGWGATSDNPRSVQYKVIREHASVILNQEWTTKQLMFIQNLQKGDDYETALSKLN